MVARNTPEPGIVYRFAFLIDGRPAYYTIGWDGERSDLRVVGERESEQDVIDELADELWITRPKQRGGKGAASPRPLLRLL